MCIRDRVNAVLFTECLAGQQQVIHMVGTKYQSATVCRNSQVIKGKVGNLYGFEIYEYGNNPLYTTGGQTKALGATAEAGEFPCSFAFYKQRVFKATGSTKMYYSESKNEIGRAHV